MARSMYSTATSNSIVFTSLDIEQIRALIMRLVKTLDREIGRGESSQAMLNDMAERSIRFLNVHTHKFTETLYASYIDEWQNTSLRGFFDPGGITVTIYVDPAAIQPPPYENRPHDYAAIEFSRGGDHDTFARLMANTDRLVDIGFSQFEKTLTSKLGL